MGSGVLAFYLCGIVCCLAECSGGSEPIIHLGRVSDLHPPLSLSLSRLLMLRHGRRFEGQRQLFPIQSLLTMVMIMIMRWRCMCAHTRNVRGQATFCLVWFCFVFFLPGLRVRIGMFVCFCLCVFFARQSDRNNYFRPCPSDAWGILQWIFLETKKIPPNLMRSV